MYTPGQLKKLIIPMLQSMPKGDEERLADTLVKMALDDRQFIIDRLIKRNEKVGREPANMGSISDGYHTFDELYEFRMLYNAAFFNDLAFSDAWEEQPGPSRHHFNTHKSKKHSDGEDCFGGGWFIVMATLPTGQISNHYELKDWDLFHVPAREKADEYDGHTPADVAIRLRKYLEEKDA